MSKIRLMLVIIGTQVICADLAAALFGGLAFLGVIPPMLAVSLLTFIIVFSGLGLLWIGSNLLVEDKTVENNMKGKCDESL